MAEGGDGVAGAEVGGEEIAFDEGEAVGEVEAGDGFLSGGDDVGPVDCGDADLRGGLREGDAPDSGAGGEVEDGGGAVEVEGLREDLRGGVAHGEDVDDEFFEEVGAFSLLIDGGGWLAGGYDFINAEPLGDELAAGVAKDSALEAGLGGDEECSALGGEGVGFVVVLGEELQADEDVHDGGEAAD